jgi:rSAM/selenodomain-associated transferase 2
MISVIIPVLNEEKCLPATLRSLQRQKGDIEIIAVDGGSSDATVEILRQHENIRVLASPRGRAPQMNTGARAAKGDWLLFLHADTLLPEGALSRLDARTRDDSIKAGGFLHRFSGNSPGLKVTSWLHNWRCSKQHIFYGDQAFFIRRPLFEQLGGYPEDTVMEDIAFGEILLRETCPVLLDEYVVTDSRKFEQMGEWRSLYRVCVILLRHQFGLSVAQNRFFSNIR